MKEEIMLIDNLNADGVSIEKQRFIVLDGVKYKLGDSWRKSYINSAEGRKQLDEEVGEPHRSVILKMWGDKPTITQ